MPSRPAGPNNDRRMTSRAAASYTYWLALWLALVLFVAWVDIITGPEYGFGFFYLVAVAPAAWMLGRRGGLAVALAAGFAWFYADFVSRRTTAVTAIAWNASSRTVLFATAAILIDVVRRERQHLQMLDRERSHFMQVVEHELPRPATELVDGLRRLEAAGRAAPEQLRPLRERAQDVLFLSRDFVSLGQLQAGTLWLEHRPVDLSALVGDLRAGIARGGERVPLTLSSGPLTVEGDEPRLRQAFAGIVAAARASAPSASLTLDLRGSDGGAQLTVSAGAGPFLSLPDESPAGVGVELARLIIEAHRGRLDEDREPVSKAARFVAQLPLAP